MITISESCAEDRPVTLEMGARDLVLPDPAPILRGADREWWRQYDVPG
jgi:hypothetical protein